MATIEDKSTETRRTWDVEEGREAAVKAEQNPAKKSTWPISGKDIFDPSGPYAHVWSKIFLASCVIAVSIDPLFLYIPVIDKKKKCLGEHTEIKNLALVLRCLTDFAYVLHIYFQLRLSRLKTKTSTENASEKSVPRATLSKTYLLIDILAIIPIPQVVVLVLYSRMAGTKSLTSRKFMNFFLLAQYVPRILHIYLSSKEFGKTCATLTRRVWAVGAFNFFLYMVAAHVLGAVWYFHSILRETGCWHDACTKHSKKCYQQGLFDCGWHRPKQNVTIFLNNVCPVNPPKAGVYDFGIFLEAIETGILWTENFPKRFIHSFWWGLRNLSNYGQNLETSGDVWEVFFAILISILGLLLFLYLIGNVQGFMDLATKKSEERRQKIKKIEPEVEAYLMNHDLRDKKRFIMRYLRRTVKEDKDFDVKYLLSLLEEYTADWKEKTNEEFVQGVSEVLSQKRHEKITIEEDTKLWLSKNDITTEIKPVINRLVRLRLQDANTIDVGNLLPILYRSLRNEVTRQLCTPILEKVPGLLDPTRHENETETVWNYLKPVVYQEKSYIIREREPIDFILFITDGVALTFEKKSDSISNLGKGDYYGQELIDCRTNLKLDLNLPMSSKSVIAHTKVEAFALMDIDLKKILKARYLPPPLQAASSI